MSIEEPKKPFSGMKPFLGGRCGVHDGSCAAFLITALSFFMITHEKDLFSDMSDMIK